MKVIIEVLIKQIDQFFYIAIILFLFIFIFALLGMEIWKGKLDIENTFVRSNFENFFNSFLTVFQLMTMENWQELLFLTYKSEASNVMAIGYLIIWIFIGNYIFLNLFLAILLDGFTDPTAYIVIKEARNEEEELDMIYQNYKKQVEADALVDKLEDQKRNNFEWISDVNQK